MRGTPMDRRPAFRLRPGLAVLLFALVGAFALPGSEEPRAAEARKPTALAWTYDEALAQLRLNPHDPYLQYLVMQLAWRDNKTAPAGSEVERITFGGGRRGDTDLFSLFTGALAVQESLQLDTLRGDV